MSPQSCFPAMLWRFPVTLWLLSACPSADPLDDNDLGDDDSSAPDDDSAGDDDDSAEPLLQGVEISVPVGTPDSVIILLEEGGTTVLDWTTIAPGESYTITPLAIGWYDLTWEGAGLAGGAQIEVCEVQVTEVGVPTAPGAVFACP